MATSSSPASSSAPLCQFFLSKKGCRNGTACRFSHPTGSSPEQQSILRTQAQLPNPSVSSTARAPVRRPVPAPLRTLAQVQDHDSTQVAASLRTYEISQVQSRFKTSFSTLQRDLFQLKIIPSDPDFPYEVQSLHVQLAVPADYPQTPCTIAVLNSDIPKGFAVNLERGFAKAALQKKSLLAHLNWLDVNMEQLLQKPPVPTIRFVNNAAVSTVSTVSAVSPLTSDHTITTTAIHPPSRPPLPDVIQLPPASTSLPRSTWTTQQIEEAALQRQKQLAQIQARFRSSFSIISATESQIALESADIAQLPVAWQGPLWINLIVPQKFPLQPCEIRLKQDDHNLEIELWRARNVEQGFRKIVAAMPQLSLFQLLNQLNRDFKDLMNMPAPPPPEQAKPQAVPVSTNHSSQSSSKPSVHSKHLFNLQDPGQDRNPKLIYVDAPNQPERRNFDHHEDHGAVTSEDDEDEDENGNESASADESDDSSDNDQHEHDDQSGSSQDKRHNDPEVAEDSEQLQSNQAYGPVVESGPKRGTEIRMPDLKLEHISLLYCRSLSLQVRCSRCKGLFEIPDLVPDDGRSSCSKPSSDKRKWKTCDQCQSLLGAHFRTEYIHAQSRTIGYLDLAGCTAFDILPSAFVPTCDGCDQVLGSTFVGGVDSTLATETSSGQSSEPPQQESGTESGLEFVSNRATQPTGFKQRIGRGMSATANCRKCHVRMTFFLEGEVKFVKQSPGEMMKASAETLEQLPLKKKALQKNKNGLDFELKVGEPLPRKGACDHYKKSRRWFRFPCCSKIYPCHLCHDESEAASHECEYAKRMVCGHCSREQSVSDKSCVCGESPVKTSSGSGAFWEGGQGMRDKTRMNNKDSRKYKGSNKTIAKKQVGAENVRKRAPKS